MSIFKRMYFVFVKKRKLRNEVQAMVADEDELGLENINKKIAEYGGDEEIQQTISECLILIQRRKDERRRRSSLSAELALSALPAFRSSSGGDPAMLSSPGKLPR